MNDTRKAFRSRAKSMDGIVATAVAEAAAEVGRGMVAVGALAAVAVGLAVKKFADFDEAMSNVKAATQESVENMGLLRDAALDAGARTVFSATEAANAIEELGKAGLSTSDILSGGLDGALDLASAGQLGVAEAAGIAATAMKAFTLTRAGDIPQATHTVVWTFGQPTFTAIVPADDQQAFDFTAVPSSTGGTP